jgi:hypothetical protein
MNAYRLIIALAAMRYVGAQIGEKKYKSNSEAGISSRIE